MKSKIALHQSMQRKKKGKNHLVKFQLTVFKTMQKVAEAVEKTVTAAEKIGRSVGKKEGERTQKGR